MFDKILYPIYSIYACRRLWKHATPEQKAVLLSKMATRKEKDMIADRLVREVFPTLSA